MVCFHGDKSAKTAECDEFIVVQCFSDTAQNGFVCVSFFNFRIDIAKLSRCREIFHHFHRDFLQCHFIFGIVIIAAFA